MKFILQHLQKLRFNPIARTFPDSLEPLKKIKKLKSAFCLHLVPLHIKKFLLQVKCPPKVQELYRQLPQLLQVTTSFMTQESSSSGIRMTFLVVYSFKSKVRLCVIVLFAHVCRKVRVLRGAGRWFCFPWTESGLLFHLVSSLYAKLSLSSPGSIFIPNGMSGMSYQTQEWHHSFSFNSLQES